jgi:hypothetical protein
MANGCAVQRGSQGQRVPNKLVAEADKAENLALKLEGSLLPEAF